MSSQSPTAVDRRPPDQPHSCVVCQRRKVKCERKYPCANCVKHGALCEFRTPAPPRRRKRQSPDPDVLAKLKRCEDLLQGYGVKLDPPEHDRALHIPPRETTPLSRAKSEASTATKHGHAPSHDPPEHAQRKKNQPESTTYMAVSEETKHLEELLEGSDEEPRKPGPGLLQKAYDKFQGDGSGLLFGSADSGDLKELHPPAITIFRLWQTYFTSVYPLTMIFHAPTVQQQILDATSDLDNISESMEALMFAIYYGAVMALNPEECEAMFGLPQPFMMNRYLLATQQALRAAKLLKSLDIMVLQALVILLIASRHAIDPRSLWIHSGTAVRLGQRIGLHRDGTSLGLPPFEIEIRRRLWWQIVVQDTRLAELSGAGTSLLSGPFDTHLPRNINDADLKPEMGQIPQDHAGTTDMTFCMTRYEIANFLKSSNTDFFFFDGAWAKPDGALATLVEKDKAIDELENRLEEKYLKHCSDPNMTLHFLTKIFTRTAIYRMRLVAHHPRHLPDKGASMPPEEKDYLCRLNLNMLENDNIAHSNKSADKFAWYLNAYFQFPAFIYLISELRHRTRGELADRGWAAVNQAFQYRIQFITKRKDSPLFQATSALALKAWQARQIDAAVHREPEPEPPLYILTLRSYFGEPPHKGRKSSHGGSGYLQTPADSLPDSHTVDRFEQIQDDARPVADSVSGPSGDLESNPTKWSPVDWSYWDELIQNWEPQAADGNQQFDFGESISFSGQ